MFFAWLNNLCAMNCFMAYRNCPSLTEFVLLNCSKKNTNIEARFRYYDISE
jgi:hypothetical protein